ncbi:MAG: hypothetical protein JW976_15140 [Syntrophaceae bacterium]|nr:hypothetical protein [Syntrophaceae bacterium]
MTESNRNKLIANFFPEYYRPIPEIDHWLRRRVRMCYWKQWRRFKTRVRTLLKTGTDPGVAIPILPDWADIQICTSLEVQQSPLQQGLHVTASVNNKKNVQDVFHNSVNDAIRFKEDLKEHL